ncbi:MAG: hypothetical protein EOP85_21065, partial [Verrucomicrobiaceae bacterium]
DDTWKLPAGKRQVLEELFGREEKAALVAEGQADRRIRHSGRRAALAIAACAVATLFVVRLVPTGYEAEATIEVKPHAVEGKSDGAGGMTPQFFGTEFQSIKSRGNLTKVVDRLSLTRRWGVDRDAAVERLKESITAENIRGTDLMSIRVRGATREEAVELTSEVTKSYKDYRTELEMQAADKAIAELNKAVRDQEDKVEERRKVLAGIVGKKHLIYRGKDSFYGQSGVDGDQGARDALQTYNRLQQEKMQLESQIKSLLKYDSDQQMVYAAGLDVPGNLIRNLYPQYLEAERTLETLKVKGKGDRHPTVLAAEDQITSMKKQLDEGVLNLRATLQAQLDMASDRLKNVENLKDDTREDAIKRGLDNQDYVDAKRDFE